MNPFEAGILPVPLSADQLGLGQNLQCELPCSTEMAEKGREISSLAKKVFDHLTLLVPEVEEAERIRDLFNELHDRVRMNLDTGLTRLNVGELLGDLGEFYQHMPENAPREVVQGYHLLLRKMHEYDQLFTRKTIRIEIKGEPGELDLISENLSGDLRHLVDQFREELAEKYGWERGQSNCCERMGYNPPAETGLFPAHDCEDSYKDAGVIVVDEAKVRELMKHLGGLK